MKDIDIKKKFTRNTIKIKLKCKNKSCKRNGNNKNRTYMIGCNKS